MKKGFGFNPDKALDKPIQCIPLMTYLLALDKTVVDYFSLDVEGSDFDVLRTIDFDRVIFKVQRFLSNVDVN